MANGIIQFVKDLINDNVRSTKTTYSSDKIEQLISSINNTGVGTEVILGCFNSTNAPTTFVQDDQYYNITDGKIYKATSSTSWDSGNIPKEDVLYTSINDNKIYAYIKGVWDIYGGTNTKISQKVNNILKDLSGQTNANENGLYVPLSKKSGNVIDNLTGQATDVNNGLFVGKSAKTDNALQKLTGNTNPSEDGLYVEDLNPKINKLNLTSKLNEGKTQEYFYLTGKGNGEYSDVTNQISLSNSNYDFLYLMRNEDLQTSIDDTTRYDLSKNGTTPATGSFVTLKAGITYNIEYSILSSSQGSYSITDENGKRIGNRGYIGVSSFGDSTVSAMAKYDKDTKIYFRYRANTTQNIYPGCSYIKIEAMEYLAIDPLQYIDNTNGTQDTPVGTIINLMGNNAPKHYLKCDGAEYNIVDYPYLAEYFRTEFGSINKFGGDGSTTFRVPDLKGEFLRNTGVNGHTNQGNGSTVGTHQDATFIFDNIVENKTGKLVVPYGNNNVRGYNFEGKNDPTKSGAIQGSSYLSSIARVSAKYADLRATRPTNTSVLYCIKAEPTYFVNVIGTTKEDVLSDYVEISANGLVDISLSFSIEDYDELVITAQNYNGSQNKWLGTTQTRIDVSEINYNPFMGSGASNWFAVDECMLYFPAYINGEVGTIGGCFMDANTFRMAECNKAKSLVSKMRMKVKGIRKTSVVQGGNFGGNGSSNPNCDCGILTTAQITKAVTDTETEWDK